MISLLKKIIGNSNFYKLQSLKKKILPTTHDRVQQAHLKEQVDFYSQLIKPGDLCFDIGGNVGLKTKVFLQLKAKVVTLEPQQSCMEILKREFGGRAILLQKGVGAENGVKEFYISNDSQLSSFDSKWVDELKNSRFHTSNIQRVEKIELVTLDSLIEAYGQPVFIKIDVEGYEASVLQGLSKSFQCLSFEYAVPEKTNEVVKCLSILRAKYDNLYCNYASGNNTTAFALAKWITIADMLLLVQAAQFQNSFAGDIYIKSAIN